MTRSFAALIGITLGLPILAMIAITAASGVKSDILMILLAGGVVTGFIVAAIFEIKRLSDLDSHHGAHAEVLPDETLAAPKVQELALPPLPVASTVDGGAASRVSGVPLDSLENRNGPEAEPIVVEPVAETVAAPRAKSKTKAGPRKPRSASDTNALTSDAAPAVAKAKRKGGQRKPVSSV